MENNVGTFDAAARWVLAATFFFSSIAVNDHAAISLTLAALAVVMIGTALTRKCPLYTVLGMRTASAPVSPRRYAESIKAGR